MKRQASNAANSAAGTKIQPAAGRFGVVAVAAPQTTTKGTTNCTAAVPRLPPAALSPNAAPLRAAGKKKEMLVIDEAKLPPPNPASAATSSSTGKGARFSSATTSPRVGASSSSADMIVQLRPPNRGTAKLYGMRSADPTSTGIDSSQNCWLSVNAFAPV